MARHIKCDTTEDLNEYVFNLKIYLHWRCTQLTFKYNGSIYGPSDLLLNMTFEEFCLDDKLVVLKRLGDNHNYHYEGTYLEDWISKYFKNEYENNF